jgi:hypothetical protein
MLQVSSSWFLVSGFAFLVSSSMFQTSFSRNHDPETRNQKSGVISGGVADEFGGDYCAALRKILEVVRCFQAEVVGLLSQVAYVLPPESGLKTKPTSLRRSSRRA